MEGKKHDDQPDALQTYELCKEFGWLPSELDKEDNKTIQELIVVMNAINEHHSNEEKKEERKQKRQEVSRKFGGGQRR